MKQRQPVLFVVFLLQVSWCFLSAGQQRLTASIGLCEGFDSRNSPLAGGSVGAVWAFASRGCVRVHVCVWVGVCLCVLEAKLVSTWFHCLWHRPSAMNLFCFTLVRFIFWTAVKVSSACEEALGKQRKLWETLLILLLSAAIRNGLSGTNQQTTEQQTMSSLLLLLHFVG